MGLPDPDTWLANATRLLVDQKLQEAANHLLACSIQLNSYRKQWETETYVDIFLTGPKNTYDFLTAKVVYRHDDSIANAFRAYLPSNLQMGEIIPRIEMSPVDPEWRTELAEILQGKRIDNQGTEWEGSSIPVKLWMNLKFRSQSEIKIAESLEKAGVLFLPNCLSRLGGANTRKTKEADFLICHEGKWGILEVDGEPFHPPSRTVHDHERDRLFKNHGIKLTEHFDADRCRKEPDTVVSQFLELLRKA
jgi:hypothetical protein